MLSCAVPARAASTCASLTFDLAFDLAFGNRLAAVVNSPATRSQDQHPHDDRIDDPVVPHVMNSGDFGGIPGVGQPPAVWYSDVAQMATRTAIPMADNTISIRKRRLRSICLIAC